MILFGVELVNPGPAQCLDRWQGAQADRSVRGVDGGQDLVTVAADLLGQIRAGGLPLGQPIFLDPTAITLEPVNGDAFGHPSLSDLGRQHDAASLNLR
ncbi:hypothetical protein [Roseomonas genomospecies 6]|uniref:hypothetical protein n=1 Tax=Roseomonas genomospecies 6 TaxID=214106 RepID=UPI00142EF5BF